MSRIKHTLTFNDGHAQIVHFGDFPSPIPASWGNLDNAIDSQETIGDIPFINDEMDSWAAMIATPYTDSVTGIQLDMGEEYHAYIRTEAMRLCCGLMTEVMDGMDLVSVVDVNRTIFTTNVTTIMAMYQRYLNQWEAIYKEWAPSTYPGISR